MLVLGRKVGKRILIPDCEVTITVLAVKGKTVRLGISAPAGIRVYRDELRRDVVQQTPHAPDAK